MNRSIAEFPAPIDALIAARARDVAIRIVLEQQDNDLVIIHDAVAVVLGILFRRSVHQDLGARLDHRFPGPHAISAVLVEGALEEALDLLFQDLRDPDAENCEGGGGRQKGGGESECRARKVSEFIGGLVGWRVGAGAVRASEPRPKRSPGAG